MNEVCSVCHAFNQAVEMAKRLGIASLSETFTLEQMQGFRNHVESEHGVDRAVFEAEIPV